MNIFIKSFIYLLWIFSLFLIFEDSLLDFVKDLNAMKYKKRKKSKVFYYIKNIYRTIDNDNKDDNNLNNLTYRFLFKSVSLFLIFFIVIYIFQLQNTFFLNALIVSLVISLFIALVPFIFLYIKLWKLRIDSSKEAVTLINEILNQYKICNENIVEALDRTYFELDNELKSKKHILRLSMRLKERKTDIELDEILSEFIFTVDTNWIKMLSNNIKFNLVNDISMIIGLEDIITQLRLSIDNLNVDKRLNNQAFNIINVLIPFTYIATIFFSVKSFNFPLNNFLKYQFSGIGLIMFIAGIVIYTFCKILIHIHKNQKLDF